MNLNFQNGVLAHFGLPKMEAGEQLTAEGKAGLLKALERAFEKTHKTTDRAAVNDFVTLKAFCVEMGVDPAPTLRKAMGQPEPLPPGAIRADELGVLRGWLKGHMLDSITVEAGKVPALTAEQREQIQQEYIRSAVLGARGRQPYNNADTLLVERQVTERLLGAKVDQRRIRRAIEDAAL